MILSIQKFVVLYVCDERKLLSFFCGLPFLTNVPKRVQILLFLMVKLLFALEYLFMDDLSRAVAQFCPSASGGLGGEMDYSTTLVSFNGRWISQSVKCR